MNLNKIIEDALYVVSDKLGNINPNLDNPYHMILIKEELNKKIDPRIVSHV